MKTFKLTLLIIFMLPSLLFLQACQEDPGEEADSEVVQARSDASDLLNNAAEDLSNAAAATANRIEDACEELAEDNC
ncbi:MAG: hypothetical protein P8M72_01125 [Gammaproteobacteria bacterium]|nr:hypothetical protein [Gammaproteobacteria bacterium]